jgi:hypothetical protein
MRSSTIVVFLVAAFMVTIPIVTALDCSTVTSFAPDVCLFDSNQQLNFIDQTPSAVLCENTNTNPFNNPAMTGSGSADRDRCNTAIREDGSACIQLYAEFQCSSVCTLCLKKPCKSFCDTIKTTCPGANAEGCFSQLPPCADSNTGCTNWDVDTAQLPSVIATTTTKATGSVTTTATTTTTTQSSTTSSASALAAISVISAVSDICMILSVISVSSLLVMLS